MYFDADEGVFVYLKNVTRQRSALHPDRCERTENLPREKTGEPKTEEPPAGKTRRQDKTGLGGDIGAKFGDVERIVATGAVAHRPEARAPARNPIKASGAIFTYNLKTDQIILSGGYPWVTQGATYMRAKRAEPHPPHPPEDRQLRHRRATGTMGGNTRTEKT